MADPNRNTTIRVLIVDDSRIVRVALRGVLASVPEIEIVGEAASGAEALLLVDTLQPQVVLADMSMPPPDGIALAAKLHAEQPQVRVIVLTMHEDPHMAREALASGAAGFVVKRSSPEELYEAIRLVARGEVFVSPACRGQQ